MGLEQNPRPFSPSSDLMPLTACVTAMVGIVVSAATGNSMLLIAVVGLMLTAIFMQLIPRLTLDSDLSFFLLIPTIISVSQNVYLTFVAEAVTSASLQFAVIINFLYAAILFVVLAAKKKPTLEPGRLRLTRSVTTWLVLLVAYGAVSVVVFHVEPTSALASLRNIVAPFLFFLIGIHASAWARHAVYLRYLIWLGIATILFGLVELNTPGFWLNMGLPELWEKKGIPLSGGTGLPSNFYSSETIDGQYIRRMVGPFADPVNFGTFLFAVFMAAWFLKKKTATFIVLVGIGLAVSKGAALGVLVFFSFWSKYYTSKTVHVLTVLVTIAAGSAFYLFTLVSSTGSTALHVTGFLSAFTELPQHPLGRGLGGSGVLAGLFAEGAESTSGVTESGIGMIVGQLGIVGLILYLLFFVRLAKHVSKLSDLRDKLLAAGLLGGFVLNAAFNEVALSPNSCAPYFVILGLVIGRDLVGRDPSAKKSTRHMQSASHRS